MLSELRVRDFVIIDTLDLSFSAGLNVITGETGAGKSILIDSIALLLGDRAEPGMVRNGCDRALIEGLFKLDSELVEPIRGALSAHALDLDADELTLAREVRSNGRSVCRINGSAINQAALREIGERLVDVHGQSEHLSLLRVKEHLNLLDDFANTWDARRHLSARVAALRTVQQALADTERNQREQVRRLDMLKFQVEEISAARLKPGEEAVLTDEHTRLANAETIAELTSESYAALYESGLRDAPAALDNLARVGKALQQLTRYDKSFGTLHDTLDEATSLLNDIARSIADYRDGLEFNPKRLQQVEHRLEALKKLKRKYGESVEAMIAFGEQAQRELDQIEGADERLADLKDKVAALQNEVDALAKTLSQNRRGATQSLCSQIERQLDELKMSGAKFEVDLHQQPVDSTGADAVEFLIAPNVGEGLKPLVKVASGGETARLMLALKAVLAQRPANRVPTLIFDEVDQGIGGRVGTIVGQKLWNLTHAHQVLCITHLPQLASYADAHFKVEKQLVDEGDSGVRTRTHTSGLAVRPQRVQELALMLGTAGTAGEQSAEQLLAEADSYKKLATR